MVEEEKVVVVVVEKEADDDDDDGGRKGETVYGKVGRTAECGNFSYKI